MHGSHDFFSSLYLQCVRTEQVLMEGGLQHLRQVTELLLRLSAAQVQAAGHAPQRLRQVRLQLRPLAVEGPVLTQLFKVLCRGREGEVIVMETSGGNLYLILLERYF